MAIKNRFTHIKNVKGSVTPEISIGGTKLIAACRDASESMSVEDS